VKFPRSDADDWACTIGQEQLRVVNGVFSTVFLVQFLDLKGKLALSDDIVVEFVPVYLSSVRLFSKIW
jgi:hypothetical protein